MAWAGGPEEVLIQAERDGPVPFSNSRGYLIVGYLVPVSSAKITKISLHPVFIEIPSCWQSHDCCNHEFIPCTYHSRRARISWTIGNRYPHGPKDAEHPRKGKAQWPYPRVMSELFSFSHMDSSTIVFQSLLQPVPVIWKLWGPFAHSKFSPVLQFFIGK